jgi:hypothetical protein
MEPFGGAECLLQADVHHAVTATGRDESLTTRDRCQLGSGWVCTVSAPSDP